MNSIPKRSYDHPVSQSQKQPDNQPIPCDNPQFSHWNGTTLSRPTELMPSHSVSLTKTEASAIAKTVNYKKNNLEKLSDLKRIGLESQCNGITIVGNTRKKLPILDPKSLTWHYPYDQINEEFLADIPHEKLLKGQILARTNEEASGFPLLSLTAEYSNNSDTRRFRFYFPELITAPLTQHEYQAFNLQTSVDHFRMLFVDLLKEPRAYILSEVIKTYNNTKPENALELRVEDRVPAQVDDTTPIGKPSDYSFYSDPQAATFWWTQANIGIPFKNIKSLRHLIDNEPRTKSLTEEILMNNTFHQRFTLQLKDNKYTESWLWHFLYLSVIVGVKAGPAGSSPQSMVFPKCRTLNVRYTHHQLIMEIMDDQGIDLLSKTLLNNLLNKSTFINVIRKHVHQYISSECETPLPQNPAFNYWLQDYFEDLTALCQFRKEFGNTTVYNFNTDRPFIMVNQKAHYLPFNLLNDIRSLSDDAGDYYGATLPILINISGEPCTVLERRAVPKKSRSIQDGEHFPFTCKSNWFDNPTEEEQKHLSLYWA